ncbi:MBG domain-containing protein [Mucilaginibacter jinjuensis]|uniref:MBG domain-containing protein n=1 Tax=Mucilaginibacter jinjuensis TaxID=1176721 RepID=A0ABY7T8I3_9SPHI|nr:MBG domain-containing protein [Mucilaginibacter jinjuensis]WCT12445.1 MBG domain-containing protein [Mucilaginibacter jinjuensis]
MNKIFPALSLFFISFVFFCKAQSPQISYSSPQQINVGATVTNITPTNTGGAVVSANGYSYTGTFAGSGTYSTTDGTGLAASFYYPIGIAADNNGNIYVSDQYGNKIRKITAAGVVTTLAGSGSTGNINGTGIAASFNQPCGIAVDATGNVYTADRNNNLIRKIDPQGVVSTLAGGGNYGNLDGTGANAGFYTPYGLAVDANNNIYVAELGGNRIRKITPAGVVTTFAGNGTSGSIDGTGTNASFNSPTGLVFDATGSLYVAENGGNRIRKISPAGVVTTVAGSGYSGAVNANGTNASFNAPTGLAIDAGGNLYIADQGNNMVRMLSPSGDVSTLTGNLTSGNTNGLGAVARLNKPTGVVLINGKAYIADCYNNQIRSIDIGGYFISPATLPDGLTFNSSTGVIGGKPNVTASAKDYTVTATNQYGSGTAVINISVVSPAVAPVITGFTPASSIAGNYITITGNNFYEASAVSIGGQTATFSIRSPSTIVAKIPVGATSGSVSITNPYGQASKSGFTITTIPTLSYTTPQHLNTGQAVSIIPAGNENVPALYSGKKLIFAGGDAGGATDGTGIGASFYSPGGLTTDDMGNIYVCDVNNRLIRKITPQGVVSTYAGSSVSPNLNISYPAGVAADHSGNIYLADRNGIIYKIAPNGTFSAFAGNGYSGSNNGTGSAASFNSPSSIVIDDNGNLYVSDAGNNMIRKITPAGVVTTLAGGSGLGSTDGTGAAAKFSNPQGLAIDKAGNIYVADFGNTLIRKITPAGIVTTLAGNTSNISGQDVDGIGVAARFYFPGSLAFDSGGNLYVTEYNGAIRKISSQGNVTTIQPPSGAFTPFGITIDQADNIYYSDYPSNKIYQIALTGYSVSPALPDGLILNQDGKITGSANVVSPATDYTVTAANLAGKKAIVINIDVTIPALPPVITAVSPDNVGSGMSVKLTGSNFLGTTAVKVGSASVDFIVVSPTVIALNIPQGSTATTIDVTNPYGTVTYNQLQLKPAPIISYTAPQSFTVGTAITSLTPVNNGGEITGAYGTVTTYAGNGTDGYTNGALADSRFSTPQGMTMDGDGNIYVADNYYQIRKITKNGNVTTLAGGTSNTGYKDGVGSAAYFYNPKGLTTDAAGNIYVADQGNNRIRKITPDGTVTTFAGNGQGFTNGAAASATFNNPTGLVFDVKGNLYVSDMYNNAIRKITPGGQVTTFAGGNYGTSTDGIGTAAIFSFPSGLTIDAAGNLYVTEFNGNTIRKITPGGNVTTVTGSTSGYADGPVATAKFSNPVSITADGFGNLFVVDQFNQRIRKITPDGIVSTLAGGNSNNRLTDGIGSNAGFNYPYGILIGPDGNLYVSDPGNKAIRKVIQTGYTVSPALPDGLILDPATGVISGTPTVASASKAYVITGNNAYGSSKATINIEVKIPAVAPAITSFTPVTATAGNAITITGSNFTSASGVQIGGVDATSYTVVSSTIIKAIVPAGGGGNNVKITNTYGSATAPGFAYAVAPIISYPATASLKAGVAVTAINVTNSGSIVPAAIFAQVKSIAGSTETQSSADVNQPVAVVIDAAGNTYSAENTLIRKITPAGVVTVFAGSTTSGSTNGTGGSASFTQINALAIDKAGNLFVADGGSYRIRKVTPAGVVSTFAGDGTNAFNDGPAASASFKSINGLAFDSWGNLFVVDAGSYRIRKITPDGTVSTFAGNSFGSGTDGSLATATFYNPKGITIDDYDNIYVTDYNAIRKITPAGVTTLAGGGYQQGKIDGTGATATFYNPQGITCDMVGNLYVADVDNHLIRKITPQGVVSTIAGTGVGALVDKVGTAASFKKPWGIVFANGYLYVADKGNNSVRKMALLGYKTSPALPAGMSISGLGAIAGTPVDISPATDYTITAFNSAGSGSATIKIDVGVPQAAPVITSIAPVAANSGSIITITGSNFTGATSVTLGGMAAQSYNVISPTSIVAVVATGSASGNVVVNNPYGNGSLAGFNFVGSPQISYGNQNAFTEGKTIADIQPNNSGTTIDPVVYTTVSTVAATANFPAPVNNNSNFYYNYIAGLTTDKAGNIYVSDQSVSIIRKITPAGAVSNFAGNGNGGLTNGNVSNATFANPKDIVFDVSGNMFVLDRGNNVIRKITAAGDVSTFAGNGDNWSVDGVGVAASFGAPNNMAIDALGNLYVTDDASSTIRKITPAGVVSTLAGSGVVGSANGTGTAASFNSPNALCVDINGNLYVGEQTNHLIRKITPGGVVTTFFGGGQGSTADGLTYTYSGSALTVDKLGNVYIADGALNKIMKISPAGVASTVAGSGTNLLVNAVGKLAAFSAPIAICYDQSSGNLYVSSDQQIRKIVLTGYVIDQPLPSGLKFDSATGKISGTPNSVMAAKTYTVTGYNGNGSSATTISLSVGYPDKPQINYTASQTFTANVTITPLQPTISGGGIPTGGFGRVSRVAGTGENGYTDGPANSATFKYPSGIAVDKDGNIYVTHLVDNVVRKISPLGIVSTYAGTGHSNFPLALDNPTGLAINSKDELFISVGDDWPQPDQNNRIIKIANGQETTFAGSDNYGFKDGTGSDALFNSSYQLSCDKNDNLYVADQQNNAIRKITPAGVVTTVAGNGKIGAANGTGSAATFNNPDAVTANIDGNLYVADTKNNLIRKITPAGVVTTFAGSGTASSVDGTGIAASFNYPTGIIADNIGNIYVADYHGNTIRKITIDGVVTTIAGNGAAGSVSGIGKAAGFNGPVTLGLTNSQDALIVAEYGGNVVSKVKLTGYSIDKPLPQGLNFNVNTGIITGTPKKAMPATDYVITATNASGTSSTKVTITVTAEPAPDISYPSSKVYTYTPVTIQPVNKGGTVPAVIYGNTITIAGNTQAGSTDGTSTTASFNGPTGVITDNVGNIYIADQAGHKIRKITPDGTVSTFAGSGTAGYYDGPGAIAMFNHPCGLAFDSDENLYVTDKTNNMIRKITPDGMVSTLAGNLNANSHNGNGTAAGFYYPYGIVADANNNLYIAEMGGSLIRKVTLDGTVTTFAGGGQYGTNQDGTGTSAGFYNPTGIVIDSKGNFFIADYNNNTIRKITPAGVVTTFAGAVSNLYESKDGTGADARFYRPTSIAIDNSDNLYVTDQATSLIRKITPAAVVTTLAGTLYRSGSGDGVGMAAAFNQPTGITLTTDGRLLVADFGNNTIRSIDINGYALSQALPAGLAFDSKTGIVSGTTTKVTAVNNYPVITANNTGINNTALTLEVLPLPAPDIKYDTPIVLGVNEPAGNLSPKNKGGPVPAAVYGNVITLAGTPGVFGFADGAGPAASFANLTGLTNGIDGNIYAVDTRYGLIRRISRDGKVVSVAGNISLNLDPNALAVRLNSPANIVTDATGNFYITDRGNNTIKKITPAGVVTAYAGTGGATSYDGYIGSASFNSPDGIAIDASGNLFISEAGGYKIRKITVSTSQVTTVANIPNQGGSFSPSRIVVDNQGNLFVTDYANNLIRKITSTGTISVFAGSGLAANKDGIGTGAGILAPAALTIDVNNNLYVATQNLIRKITPDGVVTTIAGTDAEGAVNGIGTTASFAQPQGLLFDNTGALFVADTKNSLVRTVSLTEYAISPALPVGLAFDQTTGTISGTPTTLSPATDYTVSAYNVTGAGLFKVNISVIKKTQQIITFASKANVTYGDNDFTPAASSNNPAIAITYSTDNPAVATIINGKIHIAGAGVVNITASQAGNALYVQAVDVVQALTVSPMPVTVTADAISKIYGDIDPALTYQVTSGHLIGSDQFSGNIARLGGQKAGSYNINQGTLALSANYAIKFVSVPFVISKKQLNVKALDTGWTYGGPVIANLPVQYDGFVFADGGDSLKIKPVANTEATIHSPAGTYVITPSGGDDGNYTFVYVNGTLTIKKGSLTITADDKTRAVGKTDPEFTVSYNGFVNGDDASTLGTRPVVTSAANSSSTAGTYDLIPGGASSNNYDFVYSNGKLTITPSVTNFLVSATNVTCKGQNNGSIAIKATESHNYTAVVTGNGLNRSQSFSTGLTFDNLVPGAYNVCITDADLPGYQQCFDLTVTEPKDLTLYATLNKSVNTVTLALSGGNTYNIEVNGVNYKTNDNSISLQLTQGHNRIVLSSDLVCQGNIEKLIDIDTNPVPYPNPVTDILNVNLGQTTAKKATLQLYGVTDGMLKMTADYPNATGVLKLDVSNLPLGIYTLHVITDDKNYTYKIIKR